ncbi:2TM domain-containing protein [Pustulibacterium marinum]|uniref:2TM domain-containing protein n=1 Tax=Pustulibacterium marinum TaxID=1224947 RepID=A0A1I7GQ23_9FLAO|nr:2TM domain-containing protein [Pustulibacterium marinum]SFU50550.1 2TM domain-containing protein [Pustulibacterium marinum]
MKKNTYDDTIEVSQHELIEKAQSRVKQKKSLYIHFILFLVGSVFLLLFNKVLNYYPEYNWSLWVMTAWAFLVCIHAINVFIINKFIGKEWEREQREKLVKIQKKRIAKLQQEVEKEYPLIDKNKETF